MRRTSTCLLALALVLAACGGRSRLPRTVRESFHADHRECRGREIDGVPLGGERYQVTGCGVTAVYVCPTGPHSRWRRCTVEAPTSGGAVPAAYSATSAGTVSGTGTLVIQVSGSTETAPASSGATTGATTPTTP